MAGTPARLLLLAGTLGFALLALGSGLDRASARHPGLARYVPGFLAAEAHRSDSAAALQAGDNKAAITAAERAIRADPVDPRSTALLGAGQLASGQAVGADRSFRIAARLGWRDPLTQLYFMNLALRGGQPRLAALRLDAILRQAPDFPIRDMLLAQFEGNPAGRAALAERLALRPPWTFAYMNKASAVPLAGLRERALVVSQMKPAWGCDEVAPLVTALVLRAGTQDGYRLWRAQCPLADQAIGDPRFTRFPAARQPVPFEWNLIGNGDVSASPAIQAQTGTSGLVVRVGGPGAQPVAWQLLVLEPGSYRLSWTARTADGGPARQASFSFACAFAERNPLVSQAGEKGAFSAVLTAQGNCPGQFLTLWVEPGSDDVTVDNLALNRL